MRRNDDAVLSVPTREMQMWRKAIDSPHFFPFHLFQSGHADALTQRSSSSSVASVFMNMPYAEDD
jgi:hypothetical protein